MEDSTPFPRCQTHHNNFLKWVCLEKSCERRLFCDVCVIYDHVNIHKHFVQLIEILSDPLAAFHKFKPEGIKLDKKMGFKEYLEEIVSKERNKLDDIFSGIVSKLSAHFEKIKKKYNDDLIEFLKTNADIVSQVEAHRLDFKSFAEDYFPSIKPTEYNEMKEAVDIILQKYYSNIDLHKLFTITIDKIPKATENKTYELSLNKTIINELKWDYFTDKKLEQLIFIKNQIKAYDETKQCGNIIFSNNNRTVKKNKGAFPSTVVGVEIMKEGFYEWEVTIDEYGGSYFCIGILPDKEYDPRVDHWNSGPCLCTDNQAYGGFQIINNQPGNLFQQVMPLYLKQGDTIKFKLDFFKGEFTAKTGNWEGVYKNIVGKSWKIFVSWPPNAFFQATLKDSADIF